MEKTRGDKIERDTDWSAPSSAARPSLLPESSLQLTSTAQLSALPGRFHIRELIGKGGMGSVYRVFDTELGFDVALKTLHGLSAQSRRHLKDEFRTLSAVVHPHLVQLYELMVDEERAFFTMELVRGVDFVSYVRGNEAKLSEAAAHRLREASRQLALAVAACHAAGKLHRDIKPSNILVTDAGRVVLLDFGLVVPIKAGHAAEHSGVMVGTLEYMAPEQILDESLSEAADWYSFGVTLYEAATGRLPVSGRSYEILAEKWRSPPAAPSALEPILPDDISGLIFKLLSPSPTERAEPSEIFRVLGGATIRGIVSVPQADHERSQAPFVGRESHFAALEGAWQQARSGATSVVSVQGASGIGKTELVRRFLETPDIASWACVLRGRCHPQESMRFNALDGAFDDLASALANFGPAPIVEDRSDELAALTRLFPVLAAVQCLGVSAIAPDASIPAQEVRRRALAALRALLVRLATWRTPVIWIDDFQWGDSDSGSFLRDLLSDGCGPLLLIVSFRAEEGTLGAAIEILDRAPSVLQGEHCLGLTLPPLDDHESEQLIRQMVAAPHRQHEERLKELCSEAAGSPFLLREVARYLGEGGDQSEASIRVSQMLDARVAQLPEDAQSILEVVSVAGSPLEHRTVLEAAGLEAESVPLFGMLERLSILRTAAGANRSTEIYHHRIREQVLEHLDADKVRSHHKAIADALLNGPAPNLQRIIEHFEHAEDSVFLKRYVVTAARQAGDGFAFERAADLYRKALEVGATDLDAAELRTHLGHALAHSAQAREAGETYERAASILAESAAPDTDRVLFLRRLAAEQYLQSGHDRPAVSVLRDVLAAHAVSMPRSRREAISRGLGLRIQLLFRKLDVRPRAQADVPRELIERFDASWAVGMRLSMVNHAQVGYFAARCLDIALEAREPARLALALSFEASALAMLGPLFAGRVRHMLHLARELVVPFGAYERAMVAALAAATEWLAGRFRSALELDDAASALIRGSPERFHWELALFDTWALAALALLGEYRLLAERARSLLAEADRRDDRYMARNCYLGEPSLIWLAEDRPDWAVEMADRAIAWSPKEFTTQHYHHYLTVAHALLYKGDSASALELTHAVWPKLRSNLFLAISSVREELLHLRASVFLACARDGQSGGKRRTVTGMLSAARKGATLLPKRRNPIGAAWAELLHASADSVEGHTASARKRLAHACELLQRCGLTGYEQAARYYLGRLTGNGEGRLLEQQALAWFASQGVRNPRHFVRMLAPGFEPARD